MKKIITIAIFCFSNIIASAQDGIAGLGKHDPVVVLYFEAFILCESERFSTQVNPNESSIQKYRECIAKKKTALETSFINANSYLKAAGYTQSQASLKKYYISVINKISLPDITYKESTYELRAREGIESELQREINFNWSSLATDIKLSQ
jgi:hypothetical protein